MAKASIKTSAFELAKSRQFKAMKVYHNMVKARVLEQRLIKMSKSEDGFFWIGGPGEEAFNTVLGQLIHKGQGLDYDYMHFHYRQSATLLALGMPMIDAIRQMNNKVTDPFSQGRNFVNHFVKKEWNVMPITSPIETQYAIAPGTAWAQKRHGGKGITIVTGGDAGSAEGDFASCLNFSSRPGMELPILIIVTNNQFGISTPFQQVHGDKIIAKRAEAFGIQWDTVDGNDPIASYNKLYEAMEYVRFSRRPFCLEAYVSRLHGHSSSSGAAVVEGERDCLDEFEQFLRTQLMIEKNDLQEIRKQYEQEALEALKQVRQEPYPDASTIYEHTFAQGGN
ncbi:MAG: thiamine pyrophosphate-dependent dehydrogenase E1 component subunit alpha [Deltaproteobacteria bacterium]|nr:thiamine pyrophosphate-dependent dehydrogenase E1 component subunit alpha [Deltaproteobacteria bacterium]